MSARQLQNSLENSKRLLDDYMNMVIDTADSLKLRNKDITPLKKIITDLAQLSDDVTIVTEASNSPNVAQFKKKVLSAPKTSVSNHPKVVEFNRKLNIENSDDEDEIMFSQAEVSLKCPITKQQYKNPVRANCGHTFEESAIKALCVRGASRCPYIGCTSVINKESLQIDHAMVRRLQRVGLTQATLADVEM